MSLLGLIGLVLVVPTALAEGDVDRGEAAFAKHCAVCHTLEPEYHKEGPSLAGIYGSQAGRVPLFAQYKGLRGSDVVWDEASLDAWMADPRAFLNGRDTSMTFRLKDPEARADIIAYLKEHAD